MGGAHGGCFQNLEIYQNKFAQGGGRKNMTWTCIRFFYDFSQQASSFVRSTAVCSTTFCRDLLLLLIKLFIALPPPSPPSKPPPSSRLRVFRFVSCVMSFPIYPSTCPLRLACCWYRLLYRCYTSSSHIISKHLLVGGGGGPGRPTLWRVGVRLAHLLRYHRPPRCRSA